MYHPEIAAMMAHAERAIDLRDSARLGRVLNGSVTPTTRRRRRAGAPATPTTSVRPRR